jgi:adenylosuccinate synthase
MANVVIVGGQWGDEGKGKVVDLLCPAFHHVVRFNGGNNAGHTVVRRPSLRPPPDPLRHPPPSCRCLIGPGVVVDPIALLAEITTLEEQGVAVRDRLLVSPRAHLVLPGHRALDVAREAARGAGRIGTTGRGIGPAYESRAARTGVRAGLVRHPLRLRDAVAEASRELALAVGRYAGAVTPTTEEIEAAVTAALALAPMVGDVSLALADAIGRGQPIMFEGAQGTLLDLDHGTYPFVTSSSVLAGSAAAACGLPARVIDGVLAVFKAYTTRVGAGPFPTELTDVLGEQIRRRGNEFGTTTGRPRRTGWFDALAARAAVRWNGVDAVALTKLDVLDDLPEIPIASAYRAGDAEVTEFPDDVADLATMTPVYEPMPGWRTSTVGITEYDKLPALARRYVERLEALFGVPVVLISTGPRREETIVRRIAPLARWVPQPL